MPQTKHTKTKPAARSAEPKVQPEPTQEEIQMLLDLEHMCDVYVANLRRRLQPGASVTIGKWHVSDDGSENYTANTTGMFRNGLNVHSADDPKAKPAGDSSNR